MTGLTKVAELNSAMTTAAQNTVPAINLPSNWVLTIPQYVDQNISGLTVLDTDSALLADLGLSTAGEFLSLRLTFRTVLRHYKHPF